MTAIRTLYEERTESRGQLAATLSLELLGHCSQVRHRDHLHCTEVYRDMGRVSSVMLR
jgi:hypothetical protein